MPNSYDPQTNDALPWFRGDAKLARFSGKIPGVGLKHSIRQTYSLDAVRFTKAIVLIPFQLSIMSAFMHYAQAIPMVLPSEEFLRVLSEDYHVLSELLFL